MIYGGHGVMRDDHDRMRDGHGWMHSGHDRLRMVVKVGCVIMVRSTIVTTGCLVVMVGCGIVA
jgi:hypothetical protein